MTSRAAASAVALVLLFSLAGPRASAAQPATDFAGLALEVQPGRKVWIRDAGGNGLSGRISELTPGSLVLDTRNGLVRFDEGGVHRVRTRSHSATDGAVIGLLAGGTVGFVWSRSSAPFRPTAARGIGVLGTCGAGIGAGVGALIPGKTLYLRRQRVAAAPMVTPHGVGIALRW
jgi:hypothetical protein